MDDRPDHDKIRELYAMFGLAYYQSEGLHREPCLIFGPSANRTRRGKPSHADYVDRWVEMV